MAKLTRFQAVRAALLELGIRASNEDIAQYVAREHGYTFPDSAALAVFISMVNSKMARTGDKCKLPSSRGSK
jgi:hypothetical protein